MPFVFWRYIWLTSMTLCPKENMNLLYLDDDFLNIIGDYVKADNERVFQEYMRMRKIYVNANKLFNIIIKLEI